MVAGTAFNTSGITGIDSFTMHCAFSRYETMFWEYIEDPDDPINAIIYLDDVKVKSKKD